MEEGGIWALVYMYINQVVQITQYNINCSCFSPCSFSLLPFSQRKMCVGEPVRVVGTPFGSFCPEVFLGCVWEGCVCKSMGREGVVFVTDAGSQPGCEGALVAQTLRDR